MSVDIRYSPRYSVADYRRWEGDWELIDGVAIDMGPSPFGPHGAMAARIASALVIALDENSVDDHFVIQEVDWIIDANNVLRPDIAIVAGKIPSEHITQPPLLITEILSPSTEDKDRTVKLELYREHAVKFVLLADPKTKRMECFRLVKGAYRRQIVRDRYRFQLAKQVILDVDFSKLKKLK